MKLTKQKLKELGFKSYYKNKYSLFIPNLFNWYTLTCLIDGYISGYDDSKIKSLEDLSTNINKWFEEESYSINVMEKDILELKLNFNKACKDFNEKLNTIIKS